MLRQSCIIRLAIALFSFGVALFPAMAAHAVDKPSAGDRFKVTMDSHAVTGEGADAIVVDAVTEIVYTWSPNDRERVLTMNSVHVKVKLNEKPNMDVLQEREQMVVIDAAGKKTVVKARDFPGELQELLEGVFGGPILTVTLDENGLESKRVPTTRPAAQSIIETGIVADCMVFHPPVKLAGKDKFTFNMEIGTGNGVAAGPVEFTKAPEDKEGHRHFTFSGTMESKRVKVPDKPVVIENAKYVVTGEQTFDAARDQWLSGKMKLDLSGRMLIGNDPPKNMKGTINATFELLK